MILRGQSSATKQHQEKFSGLLVHGRSPTSSSASTTILTSFTIFFTAVTISSIFLASHLTVLLATIAITTIFFSVLFAVTTILFNFTIFQWQWTRYPKAAIGFPKAKHTNFARQSAFAVNWSNCLDLSIASRGIPLWSFTICISQIRM